MYQIFIFTQHWVWSYNKVDITTTRGQMKPLNCDKLLRNPLLRSQNPSHLNLLFHNLYTFESDLNTHNPDGLTEVQLCRINVNEPQKLYRMSLIRWGSRVFQVKCFEWLMWLKVIMNWLVSLITQASQEKVIKSALLSFESQFHVFFHTRHSVTLVTLCDMWYSPLFHSSWAFTVAIKA